MRITVITALGLIALLSASCGKGDANQAGNSTPQKKLESALLQPGQEANYLPVAVGNQWTFESQTQRSVNGIQDAITAKEVTYRIAKVQPTANGGTDVWFDILADGKVSDREQWRIDRTGIYQVAVGTKLSPFSKPMPLLPFPAKPGSKFTWTGTIVDEKGAIRKGTVNGEITGEEPIDTKTGEVNAMGCEIKGTLTTNGSPSTIDQKMWFVPRTGVGRMLQTISGQVTVPSGKFKGRKAQVAAAALLKLKVFSAKK